MTKDMILHTMTKKLVRNWRTRAMSRSLRDNVSCPVRLRLVVSLLLMMGFGVGQMWGQTEITSLSDLNNITTEGSYIIAADIDASSFSFSIRLALIVYSPFTRVS